MYCKPNEESQDSSLSEGTVIRVRRLGFYSQ